MNATPLATPDGRRREGRAAGAGDERSPRGELVARALNPIETPAGPGAPDEPGTEPVRGTRKHHHVPEEGPRR